MVLYSKCCPPLNYFISSFFFFSKLRRKLCQGVAKGIRQPTHFQQKQQKLSLTPPIPKVLSQLPFPTIIGNDNKFASQSLLMCCFSRPQFGDLSSTQLFALPVHMKVVETCKCVHHSDLDISEETWYSIVASSELSVCKALNQHIQ